MVTTIGIDPHKATHTAVAIDDDETVLGEFTIRADKDQTTRLLEWAQSVNGDARVWAVEAATGFGHLLSQQLVATGETVVDVPPVLASRVRVLSSGKSNKNDENDARSVAVAALRRDGLAEVRREDEAAVLRMLAKRHRELTSLRTQAVCRLHAMLAVLRPGGMGHRLSAKQASRMLGGIRGLDTVGEQRRTMAKTHLVDIRRLDRDLEAIKAQIRTAVAAADTSVTDIYGVGPGRRRVPGRLHATHRHGSRQRTGMRHTTAPPRSKSPQEARVRHRLSTAREPHPEPRDPHRRRHPDPPPDTRPRLLRQETRRRQNKQRSTPSAETTHLRRRLPASRHRRPTPQQLNNERVREGQPGTSLNPAWPASHPDHRLFGSVTSRTRHQTYTPRPMFDIGLATDAPRKQTT